MKINQAPIFFILLLTISCFNACQEVKEVKSKDPKPVDFVDLVYPLLDSDNSRWFFFSSASRPFGMVNLSPDTEIDGVDIDIKRIPLKALAMFTAGRFQGFQ